MEEFKQKIILYGTGRRLDEFILGGLLEVLADKIEIIGITDGKMNTPGCKEWEEIPAKWIPRQEIKNVKFEHIVVTSKKYYAEIQKELLEFGIDEKKIRLLDDFLSPVDLYKGKVGIEIGGPSEIFSFIYSVCNQCDGVNFSSNTVWWNKQDENLYKYGNKVLGKIYINDATNMKDVGTEQYDFLLSSNNLEHIANPIKALKEFCRVIRPGGTLLIIVPRKENCFDHNREDTVFEHILSDFQSNVGEDDLTHLNEILEKHDYDMDPGCQGRKAFEERGMKNIKNRCLHHHVFSKELLIKLFEYQGLETEACVRWMGIYIIFGRKPSTFKKCVNGGN